MLRTEINSNVSTSIKVGAPGNQSEVRQIAQTERCQAPIAARHCRPACALLRTNSSDDRNKPREKKTRQSVGTTRRPPMTTGTGNRVLLSVYVAPLATSLPPAARSPPSCCCTPWERIDDWDARYSRRRRAREVFWAAAAQIERGRGAGRTRR